MNTKIEQTTGINQIEYVNVNQFIYNKEKTIDK